MFGGKREKVLEQELASVKEKKSQREQFILELCRQKDEVTEQFAQLTVSRVQMENGLQQVSEQMERTAELAETGAKTAGDIHSTVMEVNNAVGTFDVNHSVFLKQVNKQNEMVKEIVENNKHFTTPMKYITEFPASVKEEQTTMQQGIGEMQELSKQMGVLALRAAIEAGRLGESGSNFLKAAEEIRACAEKCGQAAAGISEHAARTVEHTEELSEQAGHLSSLLKENNISMGKLMQEGMKNTVTYESGQITLREALPEGIIGRVDALLHAQEGVSEVQEEISIQLNRIQDESRSQKEYTDELERIYKKMLDGAEKQRQD